MRDVQRGGSPVRRDVERRELVRVQRDGGADNAWNLRGETRCLIRGGSDVRPVNSSSGWVVTSPVDLLTTSVGADEEAAGTGLAARDRVEGTGGVRRHRE